MYKKICISRGTKKIITFLGIIFTFFSKAGFVLALENTYPSVLGQSLNDTTSLPAFVCYLFNLLSNLAILIAVVVVAYGGLYYLISFGRGKFTTAGKEWIKSGIMGLIIIVCAYLIAYTINPDLTKCKLSVLSVVNITPAGYNAPALSSLPTATYNEIPIGTLTENLLTRTMDCYNFDQSGNPINGVLVGTDGGKKIYGPTYLDHDRADCITQLIDGAQKKTQVIATLSDNITNLMNTCSCEGKCDPVCNQGGGISENNAKGLDTIGYNSSPKYITASFISTQPIKEKIVTAQYTNSTNKNIFRLAVDETGCKCGTADFYSPNCCSACHCANGSNSISCCTGSNTGTGSPYVAPVTKPIAQTNNDTYTASNGDVFFNNGDIEYNDGSYYDRTNSVVYDPNGNIISPSSKSQTSYPTTPAKDTTGNKGTACPDSGVQSTCVTGQICSFGECATPASDNTDKTPCTHEGVQSTCATGEVCWGGSCYKNSNGTGGTGCVERPSVCSPDEMCDSASDTCINNNNSNNSAGCATYPGGSSFGEGSECSGSCSGPCVGGACKQTPDNKDCCPKGVKDKVEHGPVPVSMTISVGKSSNTATSIKSPNTGTNLPSTSGDCKTDTVNYKGLDEFRCGDALKTSEPDAKFIPCDGPSIVAHVEKQITEDNRQVTVIDQDKWQELNLYQQLQYFQEKLAEVEQKVKDDQDVLNKATTALNKCYLAMPYVDLIKTYTSTNQTQKVILTTDTFSDPETKKPINVSKYCQGFNYDNSSCLKTCNDECPDTGTDAITAYAACTNPDPKNPDPKKQEKCIEDAYNARACTNITGDTAPKTFSDCISSCQSTCSDNCSKKYLPCSDEYTFCQSQCKGNSQCVLDNAGDCLLDAGKFQQCSSKTTDQGNTDFCINNSYLCKNGSNEFAGYQDCAESSTSSNYSASYFYKNPGSEKCYSLSDGKVNPYDVPDADTACYAGDSDNNSSCLNICPEVAKCPASSNCPDCSCDEINQTLNFSMPNKSVPNTNGGNEGYTPQPESVSAYQMVGAQCNSYSYNDDPLTFYCEDSPKWWDDPNKEGTSETPIGDARVCPKSDEIPVGQTVDDTNNWANSLINSIDGSVKASHQYITSGKNINHDIQALLDEMETVGNAYQTSPIKDYCKCNAQSKDSKPICQTNCQYYQWETRSGPECSCDFIPCKGSPCKQITDYLSDLWNDYRDFKLDFVDFDTTMLTEPRSDIIKELTYSRTTTNSCSVTSSAYGLDARLFDCSRVKDEIISNAGKGKIVYNGKTVNVGCYGKDLGVAVKEPLTDNWFCCQDASKTQTSTSSPASAPTGY